MAATPATLVELLQTKDLVYLFRDFLHELKGGENLSFWLEVECYKRLRDEELMPRGREIWTKYFDPKSSYELNIEGRLKTELQANLRTPNRNAFEACQHSIWKLLEHDCFPKFLQSQKFKDYKATGQVGNVLRSLQHEIEAYHSQRATRSNTVWMVEDFFEKK